MRESVIESLEPRTLFNGLIGVENSIDYTGPFVAIGSNAPGVVYTAGVTTGTLTVQTNLLGDAIPGNPSSGFGTGNLNISLVIDQSTGAVIQPGTFTITSATNPSDILLSGITDPLAGPNAPLGGGFGFITSQMDFQFEVTGGDDAAMYATDDIGVFFNLEYKDGSPGNFSTSTSASFNPKDGFIGTIPLPGSSPPGLTTTPGANTTLGDGVRLTDTAHLSNVAIGTPGTITFNLYGPGANPATATPLYTDIVTTNGAASTGTDYNTSTGTKPGGFVPTVAGQYTWTVSYSDTHVTGVPASNVENEIVKSKPCIITCASFYCGNSSVNSALPEDTAVVSNALNATGNLVFTLKAPDGTTADTEVIALRTTNNGNGTYTTANTHVATQVGTYTWTVSYIGDSLNNGAVDQGGAAEQLCVTPLGTIKGTKWIDVCGDDCSTTIGKYDDQHYVSTAQNPLPAITIQLIKNGSIVATTQTDANGNYTFTNVAAGTYTVLEVVPSGWVLTAQSSSGVTVTNGTTATGPSFADFKLICISGTKFNDCTGNGFSADDKGLAGITINLYQNGSSTVFKTAVTDSNGNYSFSNLGPGTYFVQEGALAAGWTQTGGLCGYTVNATSGSNSTCNNFDDYLTQCVVTCFKYEINGCKIVSDISGQLHQGDVVKVIFTISGPGTVSFVSYTAPDAYFNADDANQQKLFSVATGTYSQAGTYCLTIVVPNCDYQVDFICGLPIDVLGTNANVFYTPQHRLHDSDNGGTTSQCQTIGTCNGTGTIAGCVYNDHNNDGKKCSTDEGVCGIHITCYGTTNDGKCILLDCYTDANGNYCFGKLPSGNYKVIECDPDNYYNGSQCAGNYGGTIGDNLCTGVVISGSRACSGYNFAELCGSDITGKVYFDKDKDGHVDTGEAGIANVKLTLTGTDYLGNSVSLTTYTDANGNYDFGNLAAGTYTLVECEPAGYTSTKDSIGTDGGTMTTLDKITNICVAWSTDATGYNFGEYKA